MSATSEELEGLRAGEPFDGPGPASAGDGITGGDRAERNRAEPVGTGTAAGVGETSARAGGAGAGAGAAATADADATATATSGAAADLGETVVVAKQSEPHDGRVRPQASRETRRGEAEPAAGVDMTDLDKTVAVPSEPMDGRVRPHASAEARRDEADASAGTGEPPSEPMNGRVRPHASAAAQPDEPDGPADLDKTVAVPVVVEAAASKSSKDSAEPPADLAETVAITVTPQPSPEPDMTHHAAPVVPVAPSVPVATPESAPSASASATPPAPADGRVHRHISADPSTGFGEASLGQDVADEAHRAADEAAGPSADAGAVAVAGDPTASGPGAGPDGDGEADPATAAPPRRPDRHTPLYGHGIRVLPWKHKSRLTGPQRRRRKIVVRSIWGCVLIFSATVGWSIGKALTEPGTDTIQVRLAEWGRDHGLAGVVSTLEQWQYDLNPPKKGGSLNSNELADLGPTAEPTAPSPSVGGKVVTDPDTIPMRPTLTAPAGLTLAPGEGVFHVAVSTADDQPVVQFAKIRPDAVYTSALEDVVWIDQKRTSYVLHPGHEGGVNKKVPVPNQINADAKANLIALYNGGFKISESHGGYYDHGITVAPLVDGAASEVIFKDGHLAVGVWGRDYSFAKNPDIVSVRQNLRLMVDGGQVVPYIGDAGTWGRADHGSAAVWRSGVGVTAQGDVVYVAGNDLTAPSLANLLKNAGAEYAMQLDINLRWADFQYFPNRDGNPDTSKMYKDFLQGPTKFFYDSTKDFMAVYLRP